MKFSIETLQRDFFRKNNAIELESLLTSQQLALLQEGIIETSIKHSKLTDYFMKARDLWRSNEKVKKIVTNRNLVELVYQLIAEKPIRLGFDQLLPAIGNSRDDYSALFPNESIGKASSVQDVLCLLIICVSGESKTPDFSAGDPFPSSPGNGVYLSPEYKIDYKHLLERKNQTFLQIGYVGKYSQYLMIDKDPQVHALKKVGYVFGDTLNDTSNPILLR